MTIYQKLWLLLSLCAVMACQRSGQEIIVPDNDPVPYNGIPTIKVEFYVNRMFIDLLGREPIDAEMDAAVQQLRAGELSEAVREQLIQDLQTSQDFQPGDSASYTVRYHYRIYEMSKVRLVEGLSDVPILTLIGQLNDAIKEDSIAGNFAAMNDKKAKRDRLRDIIESPERLRLGQTDVNTMVGRLINNQWYDQINMNSINFIRSCFDNLFFRFPTQAEFDASYPIIEHSQSSAIFGLPAQNKDEYVDILVNSREFHEGMIRWAYKSLLARDATTEEVVAAMDDFYQTRDFLKVQRDIAKTDEYANF
ncbi:MAG: hypothetical protein AAF206_03885 [Bacteroidota bacterium]